MYSTTTSPLLHFHFWINWSLACFPLGSTPSSKEFDPFEKMKSLNLQQCNIDSVSVSLRIEICENLLQWHRKGSGWKKRFEKIFLSDCWCFIWMNSKNVDKVRVQVKTVENLTPSSKMKMKKKKVSMLTYQRAVIIRHSNVDWRWEERTKQFVVWHFRMFFFKSKRNVTNR